MKETKCPKCKKIVYKDSMGFLNDFIKHNYVLGNAEYEPHKCKNIQR